MTDGDYYDQVAAAATALVLTSDMYKSAKNLVDDFAVALDGLTLGTVQLSDVTFVVKTAYALFGPEIFETRDRVTDGLLEELPGVVAESLAPGFDEWGRLNESDTPEVHEPAPEVDIGVLTAEFDEQYKDTAATLDEMEKTYFDNRPELSANERADRVQEFAERKADVLAELRDSQQVQLLAIEGHEQRLDETPPPPPPEELDRDER